MHSTDGHQLSWLDCTSARLNMDIYQEPHNTRVHFSLLLASVPVTTPCGLIPSRLFNRPNSQSAYSRVCVVSKSAYPHWWSLSSAISQALLLGIGISQELQCHTWQPKYSCYTNSLHVTKKRLIVIGLYPSATTHRNKWAFLFWGTEPQRSSPWGSPACICNVPSYFIFLVIVYKKKIHFTGRFL